MEECSSKKVLEPQKALLLYARVGEISPKRIEWKKVRKNGEEDFDKIGVFQCLLKVAFPTQQIITSGGHSLEI